MTVLRVDHVTTYSYARPVSFGEHRILFRPRDSYDQRLLHFELSMSPPAVDVHWIHDVFGNCVAIAEFVGTAAELRFQTMIALDHTPQSAPHFRTANRAKSWPLVYDPETVPDLEACMRRHYPDNGEVEQWARQFVRAGRRTDVAHLLEAMTHAIHERFIYSRRTDPGTQPPVVTLTTETGTCRDFALLMMEAARALGLAARFVTGYIYVPHAEGAARRGGGATHAWVQVFLTGAGWAEFDPTNGIVGNKDLIRVAVARDPYQALPLHGVFVGKRADVLGMRVEVDVTTADAVDFRRPSLPMGAV